MAKRKSRRRPAKRTGARKRTAARTSGKRPKPTARATGRKAARKAAGSRRAANSARTRSKKRGGKTATASGLPAGKVPRLDRQRRTLDDGVPTPPSSLDMDRRGSAARSGREELADNLRKHGGITPGITGGDVDADYEQAYFSGDEAPGGDNPTPDQDVVEDIGRALGVEYQDSEELKSADKLAERDKHRWELDPASSEDYKDRD
jgi:hypothetical protein